MSNCSAADPRASRRLRFPLFRQAHHGCLNHGTRFTSNVSHRKQQHVPKPQKLGLLSQQPQPVNNVYDFCQSLLNTLNIGNLSLLFFVVSLYSSLGVRLIEQRRTPLSSQDESRIVSAELRSAKLQAKTKSLTMCRCRRRPRRVAVSLSLASSSFLQLSSHKLFFVNLHI